MHKKPDQKTMKVIFSEVAGVPCYVVHCSGVLWSCNLCSGVMWCGVVWCDGMWWSMLWWVI